MRKILLILLALCIAAPAMGQDFVYFKKKAGTSAPAGNECDGYLICQNFEGTGAPTDWSKTGTNTVDWDYTTTVLRGAQSLLISQACSVTSATISGTADMWLFARFRVSGNVTSTGLIQVRMSTTKAFGLGLLAGSAYPKLRLYQGAINTSTGSDFVQLDTEYAVWVHAARGAGESNGTASVYIDTVANCTSGSVLARPVSAALSISNGDWDTTYSENTADNYYTLTPTGQSVILDQILVSDSEISNVPL